MSDDDDARPPDGRGPGVTVRARPLSAWLLPVPLVGGVVLAVELAAGHKIMENMLGLLAFAALAAVLVADERAWRARVRCPECRQVGRHKMDCSRGRGGGPRGE